MGSNGHRRSGFLAVRGRTDGRRTVRLRFPAKETSSRCHFQPVYDAAIRNPRCAARLRRTYGIDLLPLCQPHAEAFVGHRERDDCSLRRRADGDSSHLPPGAATVIAARIRLLVIRSRMDLEGGMRVFMPARACRLHSHALSARAVRTSACRHGAGSFAPVRIARPLARFRVAASGR
jgi:hypothetical protein